MKTAIAIFVITALSTLAAEQPKITDTTSKVAAADLPAPKLTADQRAAFWRAVAQLNAAKTPAFLAAEAALKEMQTELVKTCGQTATLHLDQSGEPACIPNPKPTTTKEK